MKCLTVAELIKELEKFDSSLPVYTEGCDCYGDAATVSKFDDGVIINRS